MPRPSLYDAETRQRAVEMYRERIAAAGESQIKARRHVGDQLGIKQATLHSWIRAADAHQAATSVAEPGSASLSAVPETIRRGTGRAELITGAISEIADHGVGGMRLREVAIRVGVSVGSVSYHFPGRQELVDAAMDTFAECLTKRAAAAPDTGAAAAVLGDFYSDRESAVFWAETRIYATRDDQAEETADLIHDTLTDLVQRAKGTTPRAAARATVANLNTAAVDTARRHREPAPYSRAMKIVLRRALTGSTGASGT